MPLGDSRGANASLPMALMQPQTTREPIREGEELLITDDRCLGSQGRRFLGLAEVKTLLTVTSQNPAGCCGPGLRCILGVAEPEGSSVQAPPVGDDRAGPDRAGDSAKATLL